MKTTTLVKLLATVLLIVASAVFLAACSGSADGESQAGDLAEHIDDSSDAGGGTEHIGDADTDTNTEERSDAVEVAVSMIDQLRFGPDEIVVEAGQSVRITIENVGLALHDFTIDEMAVRASQSEGDSGDMEHMEGQGQDDYAVHMALDGGTTGTIEFTPEEAGEYQFRCTVPGHTEAGMIGTLIVTEA